MASHAAVVTYSLSLAKLDDPASHEACTLATSARLLGSVLGLRCAGEFDRTADYEGTVYFVPRDTLVGVESARAMGVTSEHDLFGGVVPYGFVATKTITHPLVDPDSVAPRGWSRDFPKRVADVVLDGFSAFSAQDAWRGGLALLDRGEVRVKPATATGGFGQSVVRTREDLGDALRAIDQDDMASGGVVVERNLGDVRTYSVGQVRVAGLMCTYCGTQYSTKNNHGQSVYGGSNLTVARGDFDALLELPLAPPARLAIAQAREYDSAAAACYAGFLASRRNYDVAQGVDPQGMLRSGVLEQSWRLGGASGAELCALLAFKADPSLSTIRTATVELYGEGNAVPKGATVYFRGVDRRVGFLTKYALIENHADAG